MATSDSGFTANSAMQQPDHQLIASDEAQRQIALAARGDEVRGRDIFGSGKYEVSAQQLLATMYADKPEGGEELRYGDKPSQYLQLWHPSREHPCTAPIIVFIHGGSWQSGSNLDSIGSHKVKHLTGTGFFVASINFSLLPSVSLEEQVQEVACAVDYLIKEGVRGSLGYRHVVLMGHSSGAHVAALLGTDTTYLTKAGVDMDDVKGVVAIDGSNYNAWAELYDSPGPIANNMSDALGTDIERLRAISPSYQASGRNAASFLLLHVQRGGDVRQAIEFDVALRASGTDCSLHVFEGESFEGHVQILLRLGDDTFPATKILDTWLHRVSHSQ